MQIVFHPVWPWPALVVLGIGIVLFSWWAQRGTLLRWEQTALRGLAIAIVLFVLTRPSLLFSKEIQQSTTFALLVDGSRSMGLRDLWDNQSRHEALVAMLDESRASLERLGKRVDLRLFRFDRELVAATETTDYHAEPTGDQSAIGQALEGVLEQAMDKKLVGVLLMTDGANTSGITPADAARNYAAQGIPIHTVGLGRDTVSDQIRDVAARNLLTGKTVSVKNKLSVRGEFTLEGFARQAVPVRLLLDDQEVARGTLSVDQEGQKGVIDLVAIPERPGDVKVTMVADTLPGELLTNNNAMSTYVTVLSDGIRVLAFEGKYRAWEPKFMRWALDQSPQIELEQLFLLERSGGRAKLPDGLLKRGQYDVFVFGDVPADRFDRESLAALGDRLEEGAGLLMMGGYESFGAGGWDQTPIAEFLPIEMSSNDDQHDRPLEMVPTAAGLSHYLLRLGAADREGNLAAWKQLRPLDGGNRWAKVRRDGGGGAGGRAAGERWFGLKPSAILLAETPDHIPLLVGQELGRNRSLAFAGDTTWRWRANEEGRLLHARFWRQMIFWLAHKDEAQGTHVRIDLDQRRIAVGQWLPVTVRVESNEAKPIPDAEVTAVVERPDGSTAQLPLFRKGEVWSGSFREANLPGDYVIRASARAGGADLGSAAVRFLAYDEDAEFKQLAADLESLRTISRTTEGESISPEQLPEFLNRLASTDAAPTLTLEESIPLWDRLDVLALFVLVVSLEWYLRRRRGQV